MRVARSSRRVADLPLHGPGAPGSGGAPGQELWVTFWDEQMRSFVEFDAEFFRHLTTEEKTQTLAQLSGARVRVNLRKEARGHYISYNVTDLTVMNR